MRLPGRYLRVTLKLLIFSVLMYLCRINTTVRTVEACRALEFTDLFEGVALTGHLIKNLSLEVQNNCQLSCYLEDDCVSYNLGPKNTDGKYVCELSDSDDQQFPGDLVPRDGFIYGVTKNFCSNSKCSGNGKCQNGFTDKGYRCLCQKGFVGDNCENGFKIGSWLKVNTNPLCFGARNDDHGSFTIAKAGSISALKLVHISGALTCHSSSTRSFWGCEVSSYGKKTLMTLVTYINRTVFLPTRETADMGEPGHTCATEYIYHLQGFDDVSTEIIFNTSSKTLPVKMNQGFQIWYGQDLSDCSEINNSGQSCVNVYVWYDTIY
ncbi:uncharacterized protein LOC113680221 isoform X1 [Pocillopora damicornis]|nr:uncharacterized protein LOC113680221 isoform X1 [Pocillopora damicornis]